MRGIMIVLFLLEKSICRMKKTIREGNLIIKVSLLEVEIRIEKVMIRVAT